MQMRCLHRNHIGVFGRSPRGMKKEIDKLTELLDAVPQQVPHVAVIPPEGDAAERGIPRVVI